MDSRKLQVAEKIATALSASVDKVVAASKKKNMPNTNCEKRSDPERSAFVQVMLGLIANFSSLAPSMSLGFSAIALPALLSEANPNRLDQSQASWVASIVSIATPVGCFLSGPISDRCGRKTALVCINIVTFAGWAVISVAYYVPACQYEVLLAGRIITGLSTGLASMPASVYMAEVSSPALRGMFTTWNATSFSLGVLIVYIFGWILKDDWGTIAAVTAAFPCVGLGLVLFFMPESPAWLITKNRVEEAKHSMVKIFGAPDYDASVQGEIETLLRNREKSRRSGGGSSAPRWRAFLQPTCFKPFALVLTYFFFQQFSGVFVIVFYAVDIVNEVRISLDPYFAICLIAATRLVAAVIVGFLSKRYGRRPLSLVSGGGMTLCMILLAGYLVYLLEGRVPDADHSLDWLPISLLMTYFFASTLGFLTMPFAMAAEVFPGNIRGMATGMITCIAYIFNFAIVKVYPAMMSGMGNYKVFFFYGAMSLLGTVFVAFLLPETKGKTLQEIEEYFGGKKKEDEETTTLKASPA